VAILPMNPESFILNPQPFYTSDLDL